MSVDFSFDRMLPWLSCTAPAEAFSFHPLCCSILVVVIACLCVFICVFVCVLVCACVLPCCPNKHSAKLPHYYAISTSHFSFSRGCSLPH